MADYDVAVIGGGIAGLTAAFYSPSGAKVLLLESGPRPGGVIATRKKEGYMIEEGPNSLIGSAEEAVKLIEDCGLSDEITKASSTTKKKYIVIGGELVPLPVSPGAFLRTPLMSWKEKLRVFGEPFVRTKAPEDESVEEFFTRRFGTGVARLVDPYVTGVNAGDPTALEAVSAFPRLVSMEKSGSIILNLVRSKKKTRPPIFSFEEGMARLPEKLAASLAGKVRTGRQVEAITRSGGEWNLDVSGMGSVTARAVIYAAPAHAAGLLDGVHPEMAALLKRIKYVPIATVGTGYDLKQFDTPPDGFGFLVPSTEPCRILGTIYSSVVFPNRAPSGKVLLTTFVGGARFMEITKKSDDEVADIVSSELRKLLKVKGEPEMVSIKRYDRAIPQYERGHQRLMQNLSEFEKSVPGLFLAGSYRAGASVSDTIACGSAAARAASSYLEANR